MADSDRHADRPDPGPALVALGLLAIVRAWLVSVPPPAPWEAGTPVPMRVEELRGDEFRLLPGVGPVLAGRLEAARVAAGGRLSPEDLDAVPGVGPVLLARWEALRPEAAIGPDAPAGASPPAGGLR
jgi:hypothetical protein